MARERDSADRTFEPTKRRLAEARRRGMVARSGDLTSAAVLLAGLLLLAATGPHVLESLTDLVRGSLSPTGVGAISASAAVAGLWSAARGAIGLVALLAAALAVVALAVLVAQVGVRPATDRPFAAWERANPVQGLARVFSQRSGVRALFAIAKVAAVAALSWQALASRGASLATLGHGEASEIAAGTGSVLIGVGLRAAGALGVLGLLELVYERWRLRRELRMSRSEWLEELRSSEGHPAMRSRRRAQKPATGEAVEGGSRNG